MMTVRSPDSVPPKSQAVKPRDYPNALSKQLELFRPSPGLQRTNSLLGTTPVDLRKLGKEVQDDHDLAVETVRLCNSSLFRLSRPVSSLEQALVATDAETVRTLLLTCWLTRLSGSMIPPRENQSFWSHSLLAAQISRRISEWTGLMQPERAFLAGLLHDIGDLPFLTLFSSDGTIGSENDFESLGESVDLQRRRFGTDHCELGGRLSTMLGFPFPLPEVVLNHHRPGRAIPGLPLLAIVGAAEAVSQACHPCAKRELRTEAPGSFIKDSLEKWLPRLNPSISHRLVGLLEADMLGSGKHFIPAAAGNVWSDSLHRTAPRT